VKILIPMAGKGKRFNDFLSPKPLIEIDGKPMIEHVVDYFPKQSEFIFICNENHLQHTPLKNILNRIAPKSTIISVTDEMLKGPAYSALAAFPHISDDEEVIVNYCDFILVWDYEKFMSKVQEKKPDGAILTFKGFHPSSLGDTYYAYCQVSDNGYLTALKEKESFSKDRTQDFGSTGTYYFATGALFKKYVKELVSDNKNSVNGEFYMSLPFCLMIKDGLRILNHEIEKFICLGTPRDYYLYKFWSEFFLKQAPNPITFDNVNFKITNIFPLAGGERDFKEIGVNSPNFLLPIMNKTLIEHSYRSNPRGLKNIFIGLKEEKEHFQSLELFNSPDSEVFLLPAKLNGNASSIYALKDSISPDCPVGVCGSTYIIDYDERRVAHLFERQDVDIILFSFSHHECVLRNPDYQAYARIKNNIEVEGIVERQRISDNPYSDHALTGTALFKRSSDLFAAIEKQVQKAPNEKHLYLSCLNNLLKDRKVVVFEVDKFIPVRWVADYKEFLYWQDYFDKRSYHPYSKMLQ
jgi:NDP-sugar pyrophosphorylase family protein